MEFPLLLQCQVAAGTDTLVLRRDGGAKGYGHNYFGQISTPRGLPEACAVGNGEGFSTALLCNGVHCSWEYAVVNATCWKNRTAQRIQAKLSLV
jgi:hypothetical protein